MNKKVLRCALIAGAMGLTGVAKAENGFASFYHDKFNGRTTACGQRFDQKRLTAAHKRLPCGTKVRVTRRDTGKSVIVTVTDRGPYVKGRVIDLSKAAARQLKLLKAGTAPVQVTVLRKSLASR